MKNLILIVFLIFSMGCATAFVDDKGVAAFTLARNIEVYDCDDCAQEGMPNLVIDTTGEQTSTLNSVFGGFFGALKAIAVGIIPRGVAIEGD